MSLKSATPLIVAVALCISFLIVPPVSAFAFRFVAPTGSDTGDCTVLSSPCQTISYAMTQCISGFDFIWVAAGTYTETVTIPGDTCGRSLQGGWTSDFTSRVIDPSSTIVDAGGGDRALDARSLTIDFLSIESLTFTNASTGIALSRDVAALPSVIEFRAVKVSGNTQGISVQCYYPGLVVKLTNTHVTGNGSSSFAGGGLSAIADDYSGYCELEILNSTISGNQAAIGGGLYLATYWSSNGSGTINGTVTNSIIWGNSATTNGDDVWTLSEGFMDIQFTFSDVGEVFVGQPGTVTLGTGTIDQDPMFSPGVGDYHLSAGSPCIDTGTNSGAPYVDFEGTSRPLDGDLDSVARTDIGADEVEPATAIFINGFESGSTGAWMMGVG